MTAATPCPEEDAIIRFILIPELEIPLLTPCCGSTKAQTNKDGCLIFIIYLKGMLGQAITVHDVTIQHKSWHQLFALLMFVGLHNHSPLLATIHQSNQVFISRNLQ